MARFVQPMPALPDVYAEDPILRSWLGRLLGDAGFADADGPLKALATEVMGPLRAAHADAEAHPPVLHRYDGWGGRVDRVEVSAGWERQRVAAAEHAVVALPYLADARQRWGARARVVQHALLHLYGPESATFTCPVAMADGAAALLSRSDVDSAVRDAWLPRLISRDPSAAITSGQWMTESQGGSDVGRATTTGLPAADGSWRLQGEKWFCSAIDSAMAVALVRPHPGIKGSKGLAPYLIPRYAADSPLAGFTTAPDSAAPGVRLHRLKDKLGTRAVPTAEVGLHDAYALPLGNPDGGGLSRMMTLVVVTRLHNAAAAAGGMRRGLAYARAYAGARSVAGGRLVTNPLHRTTLATLAVDAQAAFALAAYAFSLLGLVEVDGDHGGRDGTAPRRAAGEADHRQARRGVGQRIPRMLRWCGLRRRHRHAPAVARRPGATHLGRHHQRARPRRGAGTRGRPVAGAGLHRADSTRPPRARRPCWSVVRWTVCGRPGSSSWTRCRPRPRNRRARRSSPVPGTWP